MKIALNFHVALLFSTATSKQFFFNLLSFFFSGLSTSLAWEVQITLMDSREICHSLAVVGFLIMWVSSFIAANVVGVAFSCSC